jgi:hypothetical protein
MEGGGLCAGVHPFQGVREHPDSAAQEAKAERYERWRVLIYGGTDFDDGPRTGYAMRLADLEAAAAVRAVAAPTEGERDER